MRDLAESVGCVVDSVVTGSRPSRSMQCAVDRGVHRETRCS